MNFVLAITNEKSKGAVSGEINVEKVNLHLDFDVDYSDDPTSESGNYDFDTKVTISNYANGSTYTINSRIILMKSNGSGSFEMYDNGNLSTISYSIDFDLKAGFSISAIEEYENPFDNISLKATIKVYNNDNNLLNTYTVTEDDIQDFIEE